MDRRLSLEGVENFRDFGGYPAAGGRRLKSRRLYRSASHGRATDEDLAAIAALGIAVVVDLRRTQERARDPSRRHPQFASHVIDNDIGEGEEDSWVAHVSRSDLSEASFRDYMFRYYAEAPFNPRMVDLYARYFDVLASARGPVLIHCAAGKDRTGILAALTHHLAGVHPDDMIADYLLTNDEARLARRLPQMIDYIAEIAGRVPPAAAVRVGMGVEAAYLETALAAMTDRYGGVDAYLEKALGVDGAKRAAIAERLLEEG
ncbi:MAG TPA: tyrosine-protein phosphatase [Caulobacteraceae bacterium]|nr:tyrosine-protein phosphatase [Caulobacteraceae bacterium]